MAANRAQITRWVTEGKVKGATHVIIKCDSYDHPDTCCYPVYVMEDEDAREKSAKNQDRTMECYSLSKPLEPQLETSARVQNWD